MDIENDWIEEECLEEDIKDENLSLRDLAKCVRSTNLLRKHYDNKVKLNPINRVKCENNIMEMPKVLKQNSRSFDVYYLRGCLELSEDSLGLLKSKLPLHLRKNVMKLNDSLKTYFKGMKKYIKKNKEIICPECNDTLINYGEFIEHWDEDHSKEYGEYNTYREAKNSEYSKEELKVAEDCSLKDKTKNEIYKHYFNEALLKLKDDVERPEREMLKSLAEEDAETYVFSNGEVKPTRCFRDEQTVLNERLAESARQLIKEQKSKAPIKAKNFMITGIEELRDQHNLDQLLTITSDFLIRSSHKKKEKRK